MKIAGSEFDKVVMDLKPVEPGEVIWNELANTPRKTEPAYQKISLKTPSRVNVNIIDMTKLVPSGLETICDAGSISFGVGLYSQVDLSLLEEEKIVVNDSKNEKIISHYLRIMKKLTDYQGGFEVTAKPNEFNHVGLGSTASLTCAVSLAANLALGSPFSEREIVKLDANNYVENGPVENMVFPGQSTGASGWVALKGGLCVVVSQNELAYQGAMPEDYNVIVGVPPLGEILDKEGGKGIAESDVEMPFLDKLRHYDRFNSAKIAYWTLMELIPVAEQEI